MALVETWQRAWDAARELFYASDCPNDHFRTSTEYADVLAAAIAHRIAEPVTQSIALCGSADIVDIGGADARLLTALRGVLVDKGFDAGDLRCVVIDLRSLCVEGIETVVGRAPDCLERAFPAGITGAVIAHEWLDDIACDVVEVDPLGVRRTVLVDRSTGAERLGDPVDSTVERWLDEWWPIREPGDRAEVGIPRDHAWSAVLRHMRFGSALAIDYGHRRHDRPRGGSLSAYRSGRRVDTIPDGTCNITAHVAMDALAPGGSIVTQRERMRSELGECVGDPITRSRMATLTDPSGLGAFLWREDRVAAESDVPRWAS